MRRAGVLILLAAVLLASLAAPSSAGKKKKRKERTAEASYVLGVAGWGTKCPAPPIGCAAFEVKPGERFVDLEIKDALGQPVYASVYVYGYTDGSDTHEHICGSSDEPLEMWPDVETLAVVIDVYGGVNEGCLAPATAGTVVATFSNLP